MTWTYPTLTLVKGAFKLMAWTKMKTAIVVGAIVLLAAGTTTITFKEIQAHDSNSLTLTNSQNIKINYTNKADKDSVSSG
jgi:hypothetical protein